MALETIRRDAANMSQSSSALIARASELGWPAEDIEALQAYYSGRIDQQEQAAAGIIREARGELPGRISEKVKSAEERANARVAMPSAIVK